MRDSGSGRVIAVLLVFVLLVGGAVVGLKMYHRFTPKLVGGATTPPTTLVADHTYQLPLRYRVDGSPGVRVDAIHIPTIKGLDLTVTGVTCSAGVAKKALSVGPNLANNVYAPSLSPRQYYASIVRTIYGYKMGTAKNPEVCAVLTVHSKDPATYHIGPLSLDWRAGLFVGRVKDHTDVDLTFAATS